MAVKQAPVKSSPIKASTPTEMSVLIVTPDCYQSVRKTVGHLRAQTIAGSLELVVVAPSERRLGLSAHEVAGFGRVRVVEVGEIGRVASAKAAGVERACAPFVAFAEEHCYPEPEWAAHLLAAHRRGWAAVGPRMCNANPGTMVSWAGLYLNYGDCLTDAGPDAPPRQLPWHNISYDRRLLLDYGDELANMLAVEGLLLDDLRARGHGLCYEPRARTSHVNISLFSSWVAHSFWGGRLFGSARARKEAWSRWRRLAHVCGAPLVPPLRLARTVPQIYRTGRQRELLPRVLPAMLAGLIPHALGEAAGYALGAGDAELRYSSYEIRRARHITERDRRAMYEGELNASAEGVIV